jgi:hypothetical protein
MHVTTTDQRRTGDAKKKRREKKKKRKTRDAKGGTRSEIFSFNPLYSTPWRMNIEFQPDTEEYLQ